MPRTAAELGASGSRSMTRKRYSSGHCMKSEARDGLSAAAMPETLDVGSDSSDDDRNVPPGERRDLL
ncbi:hypothetical protein Kisp02_51880 [Kineosporia sp. NBRC 101731]|nr:hypothetical protein Kisp02_51880 [Kineosporia sp. NBRC 101731]